MQYLQKNVLILKEFQDRELRKARYPHILQNCMNVCVKNMYTYIYIHTRTCVRGYICVELFIRSLTVVTEEED